MFSRRIALSSSPGERNWTASYGLSASRISDSERYWPPERSNGSSRSPSTRPTPIWPSDERNLASFMGGRHTECAYYLFRQRLGELANPIAVHDTRDIGFAVAA